jgi:DNA-directed RNA polymerase specialized sigma24 family protein
MSTISTEYNNLLLYKSVKSLTGGNPDKLETIPKYEYIAKKLIGKLAVNPDLIIQNNDYFNLIVQEVMAADLHWNPGKYGEKNTIYGYRKQRVRWILKRLYNKAQLKKNITVSLDRTTSNSYTNNKISLLEEVEEHRKDSNYTLLLLDEITKINKIINTYPGFAKNSADFLKLRYIDGFMLKEIAAQYGCSKQYVEQTITRTINSLRAILHVNPKRFANRQTS